MNQLLITKLRQIEMVVARGYDIDEDEAKILQLKNPENNFEESYAYFKELYENEDTNKEFLFIPPNQKTSNVRVKLSNFYRREATNKNENNYLLVYYASDTNIQASKDLNPVAVKEASVNIKRYIRKIVEETEITDDKVDIIIISPANISNDKIDTIISQIKNVEIFYDHNLTNNPTEHKYYNQHIKLSDDEKYKILKEAGVKLNKTTVIRKEDAIAKWFGYKRGDLIKIIRESPIVTLGSISIQYRHCA